MEYRLSIIEYSYPLPQIITNYKELRIVLEKFGFVFESDTDTEAVAKLAKYVYDSSKSPLTFTALIKAVCKELVCPLLYLSHPLHTIRKEPLP